MLCTPVKYRVDLIVPDIEALKALNGEPLSKWIRTVEGMFYSDMPGLQEIAEGRKY